MRIGQGVEGKLGKFYRDGQETAGLSDSQNPGGCVLNWMVELPGGGVVQLEKKLTIDKDILRHLCSARSLNKVQLIGNLTRDPSYGIRPKGRRCVLSGWLPTGRVTESGEKREETEFHRIVAWNKLAELCSQLLFKGGEYMWREDCRPGNGQAGWPAAAEPQKL